MNQFNEKELRKKLRREAAKKNWNLFKESKLGMVGLYIVIFFFILAILQPMLFITGIWNKGIYDPVVGYDSIRETLLVVDCPKASEYPTEKYETYLDCGHGFRSEVARLDLYKDYEKFLAKHLKKN